MSKEFTAPGWVCATNIYEVNIRQYTQEGSFSAFAKHLPRLKDMGVETLWFMPIHPIGVLNRKGSLGSYYSTSDYLAVHPDYGTIEDFRNLVAQSHQMGFKILIDWVGNHTAWDHVWTKTNPDFFFRDDHGNFRPPYPDWEDVIKLNYDNAQMREVMIAAMKYWIEEYDIDGFRCDMAHLVPLDFWREARKELDTIKPLFWLAETEEINFHDVFDASYSWEFLHTMEKFWRRETDVGGLDYVLKKYADFFPQDALRIYFTSNHDENSHSGSEYHRMGDAAEAFAVFCATWNGVPLVYSGQELPNFKPLAFFEKDVIEWSEKIELHDFYKTLLTLHKANPALWAGPSSSCQRLDTTADERIFSFLRKNGDQEVLVILNLSAEPVDFRINETINGKFREIFSSAEKNFSEGRNVEIDRWQWLVFEKLP